jgi:hypothetical protein
MAVLRLRSSFMCDADGIAGWYGMEVMSACLKTHTFTVIPNTTEKGTKYSWNFGGLGSGRSGFSNCDPFGELALSSILHHTVAPLRYTPYTMARTEEHKSKWMLTLSYEWRRLRAKGFGSPCPLPFNFRIGSGVREGLWVRNSLNHLARKWSDNITECNNKKYPTSKIK